MLSRLLVGMLAGLVVMGYAHAQQSPVQQSTATAGNGETTIAKQVPASKNTPMLLQADNLVYDNRNNRVIARGNVEIYYNDYVLLADEVVYDKAANILTANGNVRLRDPDGSVVNAERLTLRSDFRDGFIRSLKALTQEDSRIAATNAYRKDGQVIYENAVTTSCKPCEQNPDAPPIWRVKATRIIQDKTDQNIYYEDAQFEVYGIPVAWVPYFYTPDPTTVKQRSGFLSPEWVHSSLLGYGVALPYYYAASPNYDLTLTPEFTTNAGTLVQALWRQRLWNGSYYVNLAGAYNPEAETTTGDRNWRGSINSKGDFAINAVWHVGWSGVFQSDDTFRRFYDLDSIYATDQISTVYLTGQGERSYFNMSVSRYGNLAGSTYDDELKQYVQTVTANSYPSIDYNYVHNKPVYGGEFSFDVNALALSINDPANLVSPVYRGNTDHLVTQAQWRRALTDDIGEVFTPFVQARGDIYHVSAFEDINGQSGPDATFTRQMVAGGLDYRYPFVSHTENASQVIEPVVQIVSRSHIANNNNVPNEDSQSLVFDDTLLFDVNKFSGYDRIETGTRVNYGAQYTYQTYNGFSWRVIGGQSVQLAGQNSFDPQSGLGTDRSDYVFGTYFDYRNMFRLVAQLRFDEKDLALAWQNYSFQAKLGFVQAAISYLSSDAQPDIGFVTPQRQIGGFAAVRLNDQWSIYGDLRYDFEVGQYVRNGVGVMYNDECFTVSVSYERTFITYEDLVPNTSFMVRVGIKGFGQQTVATSFGDLSPEAAVFK
jgi:LPS-assembly protein